MLFPLVQKLNVKHFIIITDLIPYCEAICGGWTSFHEKRKDMLEKRRVWC